MANSDKNIKITPNISQTAQPNVVFTGQGNVPITLKVLDDSFGTLSFEGSAGQLFSVNNNLSTGVIFSVNDISGIPQIDVNADGTIRLAPFAAGVQVGGHTLGRGTGSVASNVVFGVSAFAACTTGASNTAIGQIALANLTTGNNNTGIGSWALGYITTTSGNISLGAEAGRLNVSGAALTGVTNSIYIGYLSIGNNSASNEIAIGTSAAGKGSNTTVIGTTSTTTSYLYGETHYIGGVAGTAISILPQTRSTTGAGANVTIAAGAGVTTGAGGSVILQPGAQATSGGDGKVIVKGATSGTANLQEWQNSGGTVLSSVSSAGALSVPDLTSTNAITANSVATPRYFSASVTAGNAVRLGQWHAIEGNVAFLIQVSSDTGSNSGTSSYLYQGGFNVISNTSGQYVKLLPLTIGRGHGDGPDSSVSSTDAGGWTVFLYTGTTNPAYTMGVAVGVPTGKANKTLRVTITELRGGMTYTADGSSIAYPSVSYPSLLQHNYGNVASSGAITASSYLYSNDIRQDYVRELIAIRTLPNVVGDYIELCNYAENCDYYEFYLMGYQPGYQHLIKIYKFAATFSTQAGTLQPCFISPGAPSVSDFELEVIRSSPYDGRFRLRRTKGTSTHNVYIKIKYFGPAALTLYSGTGTSSGLGAYTTLNQYFPTSISPPPPSGGTGNGNSITIAAGSGVTTGAGGSVILQPGAQATSGGDGYVQIKGSGSTTTLKITDSVYNRSFTWSQDYYAASLTADGGIIGVTLFNKMFLSATGGYLRAAGYNYVGLGITNDQSNDNWGYVYLRNDGVVNWYGYAGLTYGSVGTIRVSNASTGGGSFAYTSSTPTAIAVNTNDLVLTGSAFQRLSSSAAYALTGIAPPTNGAHVDGRVIWLHNVGSFNITLKHNQTSTAANQFLNENGGDMVLGPGRILQCTYDSTSLRWRVHGEMYPYNLPTADGTSGQVLSTNGSGTLSWSSASGGITGTGTTNYLAKFTGTSSAGNSQIFDNGTNVGVGTASPNSKVTIGADFASITGMTIDTGNSTDSGLVIRKAANKPAFGVLAWDSDVLLSAGIYYDGGAWVHHNSTANNQLFSLSPGTGSTWYASNTSTGSWNVASNITLWNDAGIWKQPVQYASTANSYFSGSLGIGNTSPGAKLQIDTGAAGTKGLIVKAAATPTANILEVQNSSGTNLVYVDSTGDLAVGVPNATYFPSGPGAPLHVTRPTTAVATAIAAWPTYEPDTQTHARVTAFFTDGGNGGTATVATGTTNIIKFGEYYTARVVLMPEGAGGQTPADQNSGSGRDIMLLGGKSDNTAGKTGGRVFIQGGTGFAGAYGSNFGDVILQANGGRVCVGGTSPVSTSPGLDITADASNSATGQLMIKRASTNDRFRLTCGVHTSNYAFIKAYENGIGAINLALQPDVGSVGIGTTSPSDKLHVIGNVRAGNYTAGGGTYLALTGDLPGYASGAYPTLKSDGTIYLSAGGKYSAYFGDGSNTFGINRFSDNLLTTLLHPGGTSYFTGGSVAFGATTAAGGGQVYVAPTSNATKGLVVRGAASQSANLQEWQNNGGTALATVSSAGSAYFPDISSTISSLGSGKRSRSFSRVLPSTVGNYVEITTMGEYGNPSYEINAVTNHGSGENEVNKRYFFIVTFGGVSGTLTPIAQYGGGHDFELEAFRESAGTTVLRLRRTSNTYGTNITAQITVTEYSPPGNGLPDRTGTGTSPYGGYNSSASLLPRLLPSMMALDPVGRTGAGTAVNLYAGNAFVTGAGGAFGIYGGNATGTGAGGSIILQPGAQATSGGNGSVRFVNPSNTGQYLTISVSSTQAVFGLTGITDAADNIQIPHNVSLPGKSLASNAATIGSFFISGSTLRATNGTSTQFGSSNGTSTDNINYVWMRQNGHIAWYGDIGLRRDNVGTLTVTNASTGGGSLAFTSSSPSGYTGDQTDLVLNGSAFQRLSGTAARNIFSIAPPSGGSHVDGRMIRIYNVGSFNLTLKHNYTTGTTQANRMFCVQSVDIIIAPNDYAELIYDGTNNGSGAAGWRAA